MCEAFVRMLLAAMTIPTVFTNLETYSDCQCKEKPRRRVHRERNENWLSSVEDAADVHRSSTWFEYRACPYHRRDVDGWFHPRLLWQLLRTKRETFSHREHIAERFIPAAEVQPVAFSSDHRDCHHNRRDVAVRCRSSIVGCCNFDAITLWRKTWETIDRSGRESYR